MIQQIFTKFPHLDLNDQICFVDQPIGAVNIEVNSGLLGRMDCQG